MKNKNILPILLIGGGALLLYAMRRKRTSVTAEMPIKQTAAEYQAEYIKAQPSLLDKATDAVKNIFSSPAQRAAAKKAQATAVKRAVAKGISKKKAVAVTKKLATFSYPKIGGTEVMF